MLNLNVIGMTDLVHMCYMKKYEYKFLDTIIGRIFTAKSVQIGHTVFSRDVFAVDIFESASLFYFKKYLLKFRNSLFA